MEDQVSITDMWTGQVTRRVWENVSVQPKLRREHQYGAYLRSRSSSPQNNCQRHENVEGQRSQVSIS